MSDSYRGFTISPCKSTKGYAVFGRTGAVHCILSTFTGAMMYIDELLGDEGLYD